MIDFLIACSTFALYAGIGAHSNSFDDEYWQAENPIGSVGLEWEYRINESYSIRGNLEHNSTIGVMDTPGFNLLSGQILYRFGH